MACRGPECLNFPHPPHLGQRLLRRLRHRQQVDGRAVALVQVQLAALLRDLWSARGGRERRGDAESGE